MHGIGIGLVQLNQSPGIIRSGHIKSPDQILDGTTLPMTNRVTDALPYQDHKPGSIQTSPVQRSMSNSEQQGTDHDYAQENRDLPLSIKASAFKHSELLVI